MITLGTSLVRKFALYLTLSSFLIAGAAAFATASASGYAVNPWWPTNGAHMQGTQPFKAMVSGLDVSQYDMFWQVDGGQWNWMDNNYTDYQHKEASVNVGLWTWHGSGPYVVNFIARQNGNIIAQQSETIYVDNGLPQQGSAPAQPAPTSAPAPASAPVQTQTQTLVQNTIVAAPLITTSSSVANNSGVKFYINPNSEAAAQAITWASSNPTGAAAMQMLAAQPTAAWFGDWNSNISNDVHTLVSAAAAQGATPVMVAYNIPERDCGGYSSGGSNNPAGYTAWINSFAQGLGSSPAIIVLEPDALAQIGCLSPADQATRLQLLSSAVGALKADPNAKVYLDAGHSNWIDPATMANDLTKANVSQADGFALNVSNFMPTAGEVSYGQQISSQTNGKHFIVDTSRNGNGSNGQWCNPPGMAIGQKPTMQTGNSLVDAFLWLKTPGESDGTCNGGPNAGVWWPDYALGLVQNAH
ncbi:MAG: glycoside hydrolase family 6 protein [Patescibacteria group bacterium]|nr:glycoside hydrolase family 6 protein [Patescibacteria group bacterium]